MMDYTPEQRAMIDELIERFPNLAKFAPVGAGLTGRRVYFKAMPEARGVVLGGVTGGMEYVELDGTGQRVCVWAGELGYEKDLEGKDEG